MVAVDIIGAPEDVDFAIYALAFLRETFFRCWNEFKKTAWNPDRASDYRGLRDGIHAELTAAKKRAEDSYGDGDRQTYSLAVIDQNAATTRYGDEEDNIFRALKEGASGYLLKTSSPGDILNAVRDVFSGGAPFSSHIARKVAQHFRNDREMEDENQKLSAREHEVLGLLPSGYIYKEVADELDITIETVRTYVKRICHKLHVRTKVAAILQVPRPTGYSPPRQPGPHDGRHAIHPRMV